MRHFVQQHLEDICYLWLGSPSQGWVWRRYLAERGFVELQGFEWLDFRGAAGAAGGGARHRGLDAAHGSGLVRRDVPGEPAAQMYKWKSRRSFSVPHVLVVLCSYIRCAGSEWSNAVLEVDDDMHPWALKRLLFAYEKRVHRLKSFAYKIIRVETCCSTLNIIGGKFYFNETEEHCCLRRVFLGGWGGDVCETNIVSLHKHKPQHLHNASMLTQPPRTPARFAKSNVGAKLNSNPLPLRWLTTAAFH